MSDDMLTTGAGDASTLYEFATLDLTLWGAARALAGIAAYTASSGDGGDVLGCWDVDIGVLSRLLVLRAFPSAQALAAERRRLIHSSDPFGAGDVLKGFAVETFAPFPFMPPVKPGRYGNVYEFRDYELVTGGTAPTIEAWRRGLPARQAISPVLLAMYALDGPPRTLHIVAYESLEARSALRRELYLKQAWPPTGAAEHIAKATSTIALPTVISQLA